MLVTQRYRLKLRLYQNRNNRNIVLLSYLKFWILQKLKFTYQKLKLIKRIKIKRNFKL